MVRPAFRDALEASARKSGGLVCVGLDPEPELIPAHLGAGPEAATAFLRRLVAATAEHAAAFKPNMAFFEQYGAAMLDVLVPVLESIPREIPVIIDAKRGDVPNTAVAYARALFDRFDAGAATVAPYLGLDSIAPFCGEGRFALVLARTSNPGARDFQDLRVDGRPLYEHVVERCVAAFPADRCGFVVGATYPAEARRLRTLAPDRLFLMPGVGAQGGDAGEAVRAAADANGGGFLVSSSRSVMYASRGADFESAAATAAAALKRTVNDARASITAHVA